MQCITLKFNVDGNDFAACGQASAEVKKTLKQMGVSADAIRKVAIAMYEGEINMVIHANGGTATVDIFSSHVIITLADTGPGIANIDDALTEGFTTATDAIRELGFGAGMGLPNMKKYSDEMHIDSTVNVGTTVTMKVYI